MTEKLRMRELTTDERGLPRDLLGGMENAQSFRVVVYPVEQQRGRVAGRLEVSFSDYDNTRITPLYRKLHGFDLLGARVSSWKKQWEALDRRVSERFLRWVVARVNIGGSIYG